jgi:hypothetical protein
MKTSKAQPGEEYWVRVFVEDEDLSPGVQLVYRINNGSAQFMAMADDGNHHDKEAGDGYYGVILPALQLNTTLSWQVDVTDEAGKSIYYPYDPVLIELFPSLDPQLFINEMMAGNDSTIADEFGEYENWLEIYNGDDEPVYLGDKYLSDNLSNPDKWKLPPLTMQPGTFIIIWADGQPDQGPLHANFKLNDEGEELGIFDNETTGYFLIDSVTFGLQTIDISYGRQSDGQEVWIFFQHPTPGYSNMAFEIKEEGVKESGLLIFPNPVKDGIIFFGEPFSGRMTDILGKTIWKGENVDRVNVSGYPAGLYMLVDHSGRRGKVIIP